MIFESHAHYDDEKFDQDREQLLNSMREHNIEYIVNIGASLLSSKNTMELIDGYPFVYGTVGVHPSETMELNEENFEWLKNQTKHEKIVGVGEIGLDYYWEEPDRETQKKWFFRQMELSKEVNLPMIIHSRDAAKDTYDFMKQADAGIVGGVIHCFSYGKEMAKSFLDMGFYLGIGGVVTFKNGRVLKEVVEYMPLDRILLETDSPYLSPVPNRGKRNSSLNLTYIAKEIALIKNIDYEQVVEITSQNAKRVYRMGDK